MPIETPPPITPVPTPVPQRGDRATFSDRVDAFVTWLEGAPPQFEAVAENVENNATEAATSASAAAASAAAADASADAAATSETAAAASAAAALASETAAEAAADMAIAQGASVTGTSTTNLTISTGTKSLTTQTNKQFEAGQFVTVASVADPANYMHGQITAYDNGTGAMDVTVTSVGGAGTFASWNISLSGARGATGATGSVSLQGTATGAIEWNGVDTIASASTTDLQTTDSNAVRVLGTTTINSFGNAAAGVWRDVIFDASLQLTFNASTMLLPGLLSIQTATNDTARFTSLGGGAWICNEYKRNDGRALASDTAGFTNMAILTTSQTWNARITGPHRVTLIGASGSGAIVKSTTISGQATGSGAGGLSRKTFNANAGQGLVFTLAAGGARVSRTTNGGTNGNASSASTMTTTGISLTANPGAPGVFAVAAGAGTPILTTLAGPAGGTASGGDQNFTGGDGGDCGPTGTTNSFVASGGGAVNWFGGTPYKPGTPSVNPTTRNNAGAATGGAGIGGRSGDAVATTDATVAASGGGGAGAGGTPSATSANASNNATTGGIGSQIVGIPTSLGSLPLNQTGGTAVLNAAGNAATTTQQMGAGGGASATVTGCFSGGDGGRMGGGAGTVGHQTEVGTTPRGGDGLFGGGAGGCAAYGIAQSYQSGKGGDAWAIVEW